VNAPPLFWVTSPNYLEALPPSRLPLTLTQRELRALYPPVLVNDRQTPTPLLSAAVRNGRTSPAKVAHPNRSRHTPTGTTRHGRRLSSRPVRPPAIGCATGRIQHRRHGRIHDRRWQPFRHRCRCRFCRAAVRTVLSPDRCNARPECANGVCG
jgi:hypothetical protein